MKKKMLFFVIAVCISLLGATYRWSDSAHSIGLFKAGGGEARHAASLESGKTAYTLIATATVMPPYRGDAKVVLEGTPRVDYKIYSSEPVINLGLSRQPRFKDNILYDLRPKDRIALWVVIKPPVLDPVCGMAYQGGYLKERVGGKDYYFCCDGCRDTFLKDPARYAGRESVTGTYSLTFYDTKTEKPVLRVPLTFAGKGETKNASSHQH